MNTITLARFKALDRMNQLQADAQLSIIINLINDATLAELRKIDTHLLVYEGVYKNDLKAVVDKCKTYFPQYRQPLIEKLKVIYMSQVTRNEWKIKFLMALLPILVIFITGIAALSDQYGPNGQIVSKRALSMLAIGFGIGGVVIVVAVILLVYGFCGVFGWGSFKGIISRDLEQFKKSQEQTQNRLN